MSDDMLTICLGIKADIFHFEMREQKKYFIYILEEINSSEIKLLFAGITFFSIPKKYHYLFHLSITFQFLLLQIFTLLQIMKIQLFPLIVLLLLQTVVQSDEFNLNYNYDDFYRQFGRTYQGEEKRQHEQIFNQNYAKLRKRILNGENVTVDKFLDWNQTQLDAFFPPRPQNSAKSSPNSLSRSLRLLKLGYFTIPPTFDWRDYGKVTSVKDQGGCGSCWTFSATGQYESAIAIATNGSLFDLSEEYVGECTYTSGGGCSGGHQYFALKMVNRTGGIPLQKQYPYQGQSNYYRDRGFSICSQPNKTVIPVKIQQIINIGFNTSEQIQQSLLAYGPLSVGVYAGWFPEGRGYYSCTNPKGINHGVLLVGYTQTHWIIKNSWGEGWGDKGYFYLPKQSQYNCRLHQDLVILHLDYGFNPTPLPPNPNPPPVPPSGSIIYNVSMTDSFGDGWEGTILGIRQNGVVVATFGNDFTSGKSKNGIITITNTSYADILVVQLGNWTDEVGFVISFFGKQIFRRVKGESFPSNTIFYKFCPSTQCEQSLNVTYYLTLYDSYGDGWNGNILAFNQSGAIQTFTLKNGKQTTSPIPFTFKKHEKVFIYVHIIGTWTEQCGYQLKTFDGRVVISRVGGEYSFLPTTILSRFYPEGINYAPALLAPGVRQDSEKKQKISPTESGPDQKLKQQNPFFKIETIVLASLLIVFISIAIFAMAKAWFYRKELIELRNLKKNEIYSAKAISVQMN